MRAQAVPYYCDGCGVMRKETNHWFVMFTAKERKGEQRLHVSEWTDAIATLDSSKHICGHRCAHKLLDYWLEHKSLDGFNMPSGQPLTTEYREPPEEQV